MIVSYRVFFLIKGLEKFFLFILSINISIDMSIPVIQLDRIPNYIDPVNRELWFETSSTASNSQDFKYIYQVQFKNEPFDTNSFTNLSTLYKVPPRPSDGHGFFTPHQILKSYFQYYPSPFQKGWASGFVGTIGQNAGILDNYFEYRLKYGFEYNPQLTFARTFDYLGNLGLSFSTAPGLLPGDLIIIDKDNKFVNPSYDGTASVIGTQSATQIILDIAYGVATNNESGNIINLQRISATTSSRYTFNGTRQYEELNKDYTQYVLGYTNSQAFFLTDWQDLISGTQSPINPKNVYIGPSPATHQYETLSMIDNSFTASTAVFEFYDIDNQYITGASVVLSTGNRFRRLDLGVGPQNIEDQFGTGFIDFSTGICAYYLVRIVRGVSRLSIEKRYNLKSHCLEDIQGFYNYQPLTFIWLNRLGGWDYFTFIKDNKKTTTIERTNWQRTLPIDYTYGQIYRQANRGTSNLSTFAEETYEVKSDWINDNESIFLENLFTSPEVYIIINGTYSGGDPNVYQDFTGRIQPINIISTSYETKTTLRDKMYNLTVNYKWSLPVNLQNQ